MANTSPDSSENTFKEIAQLLRVELEILGYIKKGHTSREIALFRHCSVRTIEKHHSHIIKKLGLEKMPNVLLRWSLSTDTKLNKSTI